MRLSQILNALFVVCFSLAIVVGCDEYKGVRKSASEAEAGASDDQNKPAPEDDGSSSPKTNPEDKDGDKAPENRGPGSPVATAGAAFQWLNQLNLDSAPPISDEDISKCKTGMDELDKIAWNNLKMDMLVTYSAAGPKAGSQSNDYPISEFGLQENDAKTLLISLEEGDDDRAEMRVATMAETYELKAYHEEKKSCIFKSVGDTPKSLLLAIKIPEGAMAESATEFAAGQFRIVAEGDHAVDGAGNLTLQVKSAGGSEEGESQPAETADALEGDADEDAPGDVDLDAAI